MADGQVDPARLKGEALRQWYLRTPADIAAEREAAASKRYAEFIGGARPQEVARASASNWMCRGCHWNGAPPFSGNGGPMLREGFPAPRGGAPKGDRPECDIQLDRDTAICNRQPNTAAQSICQGTAMERYAYCRRPDGHIGWPDLFTHPNGPRR